MSDQDSDRTDVSRRQFLRSAGLIGASAALGLRAQAQQPSSSGPPPAQPSQVQSFQSGKPPETADAQSQKGDTASSGQPPSPGPHAPQAVVGQAPAGEGEIPRRPLGKTGVQISALGVGGHHLGDAQSVTEAVSIVHEAIDAGINFFDNCWEYHNGKSENWLGRALAGGRRDKVFLMTKVCTHGRSGDLGLKMLEESLRRLQTDHLDLWQVHAVTYDNDPELAYAKGGILEAMDRAKQQGKVRFVGFTGHKDPGFHLKMIQMGYPFDTVQMPLNAFDANFFSFENQVLPEANRRGIGVLGMKSMMGGADAIKQGLLTAEEALRYAMSLPVATTISGMESLDVLHQNLRVARGFRPMTAAEMQELRQRCAPTAGDGRYELYKVSLKYDNPLTRMPHSFPIDGAQKEVKDWLEGGSAVPGSVTPAPGHI